MGGFLMQLTAKFLQKAEAFKIDPDWAAQEFENLKPRFKDEMLTPDQKRQWFEAMMAKQPKEPGEGPFYCSRCGEDIAEGRTGFIDKDGYPVHEKCRAYPEEVKDYQNANGGNGYQLNPKYFPAWHKG
jgi:hypothetical protein